MVIYIQTAFFKLKQTKKQLTVLDTDYITVCYVDVIANLLVK